VLHGDGGDDTLLGDNGTVLATVTLLDVPGVGTNGAPGAAAGDDHLLGGSQGSTRSRAAPVRTCCWVDRTTTRWSAAAPPSTAASWKDGPAQGFRTPVTDSRAVRAMT
jgi:hypothetical protein